MEQVFPFQKGGIGEQQRKLRPMQNQNSEEQTLNPEAPCTAPRECGVMIKLQSLK
jgi:hypothetical protein